MLAESLGPLQDIPFHSNITQTGWQQGDFTVPQDDATFSVAFVCLVNSACLYTLSFVTYFIQSQTRAQSRNIIGHLHTHPSSHNTIGQCLLYNMSHTAVSLVLYAVDKGLHGRKVLQSLLLILLCICSRWFLTMILPDVDKVAMSLYDIMTMMSYICKFCTFHIRLLHCFRLHFNATIGFRILVWSSLSLLYEWKMV